MRVILQKVTKTGLSRRREARERTNQDLAHTKARCHEHWCVLAESKFVASWLRVRPASVRFRALRAFARNFSRSNDRHDVHGADLNGHKPRARMRGSSPKVVKSFSVSAGSRWKACRAG